MRQEKDNQNVDDRQIALTFSHAVRVTLIQFPECCDSLETFYLILTSPVPEIIVFILMKCDGLKDTRH